MRLTLLPLILLFALAGVSYALPINGQEILDKKISIRADSEEIKHVLSQISKTAKVKFVYSAQKIPVTQQVSIFATDEKLSDVLRRLLEPLHILYSVTGKQIILTSSAAIQTEGEELNKMHSAAAIKIKGRVLKDDGTPLQGATVSLTGSSARTQTDENGYFELTVENTKGVIEISYTGFQSIAVNVNEIGLDYSVVLKANDNPMDEVVVIGYGTQKKKNINGAISTVKAKDLVLSANSNVLQALAGKTPGLQAIQSSGQPGAAVTVQLRGNPSMASSGVLYVLDGVIINDAATDPGTTTRYGNGGVDRSPLNFLNPNDIETIDFIKDASAAAIYGARAGGGVILITTKKGSGDKAKIEYSTTYATQKPVNAYDLFGTKEYMEYRNQMVYENWLIANQAAPYGPKIADTITTRPVYRFTQSEIDNAIEQNPMDAILRTGTTQQHNISVAGASGKTRYFVSGNYYDAKGVIIASAYKRMGARLNLTHALSNKIRFGVNATYTQARGTNANTGDGQFENAGIILSAIYFPPYIPLRGADGSYPLNPDNTTGPNPLSFATVTDFNIEKRLLGNVFGEWDIVKGLTYRATASFDQSSNLRDVYQPKTFLYGDRANGYASKAAGNSQTQMFEHTLNFKKIFKKRHSADLLAGYSYQKTQADGFSASAQDFLTDNFLDNSLQSGSVRGQLRSYKNEQVWASYFSRLIYTFNNRYTLSGSIRADGSSIFAENKKWGYFPSVSAGWVVSDEPFLKNNKYISFLKMSLAYGATGNSNISGSAFSFYSPGSSDDGGNYVFGTTENVGVFFRQLANNNLTWEKVKELNFHVDLQAFKGRIGISLDVFKKNISGLLATVPLTTDFIVSSVFMNAGKTKSTGWEIGLNTHNIVSKTNNGFNWSTNFNFSQYINSWVERNPDALKTLPKYVLPYAKGSFDALYAIQSAGIYKGGTKPSAQPNLGLGGVILRDVNGYDANNNLTGVPDGKITDADNVIVASRQPKFNFGFTNTFRYKGFDVTIYMYGLKRKQYNYDMERGWTNPLNQGKNRSRFIKYNGWSSFNQDGNFPRQISPGNTGDFWYEDASFIRCRDLMIGYTLPAKLISRQNIVKSIRVTANVQNAFVITKYSGLDPELSGFVSYPNPRSIILGFNVSF